VPEQEKPFKLPHAVIVKSPGLLPMLYTVRELAAELGLPERTLRDWLARGAPHQRDQQGHIWINGSLFSVWAQAQRKPKPSPKLADDQAYCLHCRAVVTLVSPQRLPVKGKLVHIKGKCSICGCTINRGSRVGKTG